MACIKPTGHGIGSVSSRLLGSFERKLGLAFYEASNLHLCSFFLSFFIRLHQMEQHRFKGPKSPMIVRLSVELEKRQRSNILLRLSSSIDLLGTA